MVLFIPRNRLETGTGMRLFLDILSLLSTPPSLLPSPSLSPFLSLSCSIPLLMAQVHLIIRFANPTTGEIEEKHSKQSSGSMDFFSDKKTHLFTLSEHTDLPLKVLHLFNL